MNEITTIVGAGPCAAAAAQGLRNRGYDGEISIIGDEISLPYERPPLSKDYMANDVDANSLLIHPSTWYSEQDITFIGNVLVVKIDIKTQKLILSNGDIKKFNKLLIATGGSPRNLAEHYHPRVCTLRNLKDADEIKRHIAPGARFVVLGGGFIGAEVAATARQKGADVTIIEACSAPMLRVLGQDIGDVYSQIHKDKGVKFQLNSTISDISKGNEGLKITTSKGVILECDILVVGIGLIPNVGFLEGSNINIDNGILVDAECKTNIENIFAAGDVANHYHPLFDRQIRVEHHDNALQQGDAAAANMLGVKTSYETVHWVWSDQYEYNMQFAGSSQDCNKKIIRGSIDERQFSVFYLQENRLLAVLGVNNGRDVVAARRLIGKSARVDLKKLADTSVRLKDAVL